MVLQVGWGERNPATYSNCGTEPTPSAENWTLGLLA